MRKLDGWRGGRAGTVLFYSYLLAILATAALAFCAFRQSSEATSKLRAAVHKIDAQGERQCKALGGALAYWTIERDLAFGAVRDPDTPSGPRVRAAIRLAALNKVIDAGSRLTCR